MTEHRSQAVTAGGGNALHSGSAGTLDEIFHYHAHRRPDALALADPPDRESFTDGSARRLTYLEVERAVKALSLRLHRLGLSAGAIVAFQLPNTVEAVVTLLGIIRAGCIAAPVPLLWRKAEATAALRQVNARALICCRRIADVDHAEVALEVAAEVFSIRAVCGFGTALPDGIVPLDAVFTTAPTAPRLSDAQSTRSADDLAIVTFDAGGERMVPIARTHTELLVGGVAIVLEAEIAHHGRVLGTLLPLSFAALASGFVPWLLTGGTLVLHHPFDPTVFVAQCRDAPFDAIVLPGPLVESLVGADIIGGRAATRTIVGLWRAPERQAASPPWRGEAALVDVLAFGEIGLVAMRRAQDGAPRLVHGGPVTAPYGTEGAAVVMTATCTREGTLALSGPMVAHRRFPFDKPSTTSGAGAPVDTGYACRLDLEANTLTVSGVPGQVGVGGYRFVLRELQDVVGGIDAEGILAALPDALSGQRLAGVTADQPAMREALTALGMNPLVSAAFRSRQTRAPAA